VLIACTLSFSAQAAIQFQNKLTPRATEEDFKSEVEFMVYFNHKAKACRSEFSKTINRNINIK